MKKSYYHSGNSIISHLDINPTIGYNDDRKQKGDKIMYHKKLRPDAKGRIVLGALAKGVAGFLVTVTHDHKIILEPYSEIPSYETWLFENKTALTQVKKGLQDAKEKRLVKRGSFSKFTDKNDV